MWEDDGADPSFRKMSSDAKNLIPEHRECTSTHPLKLIEKHTFFHSLLWSHIELQNLTAAEVADFGKSDTETSSC